jgi:hypothetical protein
MSRWVALCSMLWLATVGGATGDARSGWDLGAGFDFKAAELQFRLQDDRESQLGRAVMLFSLQPKTRSNLTQSEALLRALRAAEPADDSGIAALYYLARIAQLHISTPDLVSAKKHYATLIEQHGDHHFGQLARLKLAMLTIYAPDDEAPAEVRLSQAETIGAPLVDAHVKCDFHLLLAAAHFRFSPSWEPALTHLLAAEATGQLVRDSARASTFVQVAECGRVLGQPELASVYYQKFLEQFPRDQRAAEIRRRLAQLQAPQPASSVP